MGRTKKQEVQEVEEVQQEVQEVESLNPVKSYDIEMLEDYGLLKKNVSYNVAGNLATKIINQKKAKLI